MGEHLDVVVIGLGVGGEDEDAVRDLDPRRPGGVVTPAAPHLRGRSQPQVTVLAFPGCPHRDLAVARASRALLEVGSTAVVDVVDVATRQETATAGFRGSPTVLIDGRDPFPASDSTAWACRLYRTERGLEGAPSQTQLRDALMRVNGRAGVGNPAQHQ